MMLLTMTMLVLMMPMIMMLLLNCSPANREPELGSDSTLLMQLLLQQ